MRLLLVLISLVAGWLPVAGVAPAFAAGDSLSGPSAEACYWLERAALGRDAAYVPGVDAYGQPVATADLNPAPIDVPDLFEFEIVVDLADDLPPGSYPAEMQQRIAQVAVDPETGAIWVDGEPLGRHDAIDVEAGCTRAAP